MVAYNQPLAAEEVGRLRGKPSGHLLSQLVRRDLLRVERTDEKPRKSLYYTTPRFLEFFHIDSLEDLPRGQELDRQ
jgi:segregation and condensation protein B